MVDRIVFETDEIERLVIHLFQVPSKIMEEVNGVTKTTTLAIQRDARASVRWSQGARLAPLVNAIGYDLRFGFGSAEGEIGYDRDKPQGNLGHIIEYGGSTGYNSPNAPQRNLANALAKNRDDYATNLRKAFYRGLD